jgi:hypothetical protein
MPSEKLNKGKELPCGEFGGWGLQKWQSGQVGQAGRRGGAGGATKNTFAICFHPKREVYYPTPYAQFRSHLSTHMGWRFWVVGFWGLDASQVANTFLLK